MLFSLDDLQDFISSRGSSAGADPKIVRTVDRDFIVSALDNAEFVETSQAGEYHFAYEGRDWRADYRNLRIGTQDISIGVFVPVDALWITDFYLPVQIAVLFILLVSVLLLFFLVRDFRVNAAKVSKAEILEQLIAGGESSSLEFKSSLRWDYRQLQVNKDLEGVIMKSVAAFSNTNGGTLLLGIDDSGKALGLESDYCSLKESGPDYFELHLRTLLIGQYGTDVASRGIKVDFVSLNGNDVCRLLVAKGLKPLYTKLNSKSGSSVEKFFVRSGNSSRAIASLAEITSYVVNRFGRRAVE